MVIEGSWVALAVSAMFVIVPSLMIVAGFCSLLWPRMMWFLSEGWKYKNDIEPSGCFLFVTRIGGLFIIVFASGFLLFVLGFFSRSQ